jgi:hypothetical protein
MSVHVLRAQGTIFSDLTRRFGANPARFHEILSGRLHPGSWEMAVDRIAKNDPWNDDITQLLLASGQTAVLDALSAANPAKRRFQQQLKRLRRSAPPAPAPDRSVRLGLAGNPVRRAF